MPYGGLPGPGALALLQEAGNVLHDGRQISTTEQQHRGDGRRKCSLISGGLPREAGREPAERGLGRPLVVKVTPPPRSGRNALLAFLAQLAVPLRH